MAPWVIAGLALLIWTTGSAVRRSWAAAASGAAALGGLAVGFLRLRHHLVAEVDHEEDVERLLALVGAAVLVALGFVGAGILCRWKGKPRLAWCGIGGVALAVTLEGALAVVSDAGGRDRDPGEAMGIVVLWIFADMVVLATASVLVLAAVVGAVRLAKPDSPWAARWYGQRKLALARRRFRWPEETSNRFASAAVRHGVAARRVGARSELADELADAGAGLFGDIGP